MSDRLVQREYKIVCRSPQENGGETELNRLGREGWRVITFSCAGYGGGGYGSCFVYVWTLERTIPEGLR